MEELFARLEKSLSDLAALEGGTDTVDMTHEEFLQWVLGQVELAKDDSCEIRKARLMHASNQLGRVRKDFIGPTPVPPGAKVSVMMFKDPDQQTTTAKTVEPSVATAATVASSNPVPPTVKGAGKVNTGGMVPPVVAGSSGFAAPAVATFAKSLEAIEAKLDTLAGEPAKDEPTAGEPAKGEPTAGEPVKKSVRMIWPLDMSTDFGMGKVDDPGTPEWGFDRDLSADTDAAE